MENHGIVNVLTDLASSKVKERNQALDDLTTTLKQRPDLVPTKLLAPTAETLIELVEVEKCKYCELLTSFSDSKRGKLSLSENKLSSVSYVLRLLVEKTCSRFKIKTLKLLLAALPELTVREGSLDLLEPSSVHLSYALLALVKSDLFQLKFSMQQWVSMVDKTCSLLDQRIKTSINDRNVSNFFALLSTLMAMDTIGVEYISAALARTLTQYLRLSQKENVNTRLALLLVNQLTVKAHCLNIRACLQLIKETWKHAISIAYSNNSEIQRELCYLDVLASDLVCNKLPIMTGHDEAENSPDYVSLSSLLHEYLTLRLANYRSTSLPIQWLRLDERREITVEWFELTDFQLKEKLNAHPWFNALALTKLLNCYYFLLESKGKEKDVQLFKKRKVQPQWSSLLRDSYGVEDFICNSLGIGNAETQLCALQIFAFHASMQDLDLQDDHRLRESLLRRFGDVEHAGWTCLCLTSLISQQGFLLEEIDLNRIFKLCLPLVKVPEKCQVACRLLSNAIKYSKLRITDTTTLNQIYDTFELSPINGPSVVCNEAFAFWQYLETYGKEVQFRLGGSTASKILEWLTSKWDQLLRIEDHQNLFYDFLSWLSGRKKDCVDDLNDYPSFEWKYNSWQDHFFIWQKYKDQRAFLLQKSPSSKHLKSERECNPVSSIFVERTALNEILYRLLGIIEDFDEGASLLQFKWAVQVLKLMNCLSGDSSFLEYAADFKRTVSLVLPTMTFKDKVSYIDFFQTILRLNAPNVEHIVFQGLRMKDIIMNFRCTLNQVEIKQASSMTEFDAVFDHGSDKDTNHQMASLANPYYRNDGQISVESLLRVLERTKEPFNSSFEVLLDFLNGMETDILMKCFCPIIRWLGTIDQKEASYHRLLEQFTQLLSDHLLNKELNTSNQAIYLLCSYLDVMRSQWLANFENSLNSDCNDILDWVISRFEENAFSGLCAIAKLSRLLLHMLRFNDLSRTCVKGGKQRIFATFTDCLKKLDKATILTELPEIITYMSIVSYKNQRIIFSEIKELFDVPQQSIEYSAFYVYSMLKMSSMSYSNLVFSMQDMTNYSSFGHTRTYIIAALERMVEFLELQSPLDLLDISKFDMIHFWCSKNMMLNGKQESQWDIELYGFENLEDFLCRYNSEITAFCFSKDLKSSPLMEKLCQVTNKTVTQLFSESFHMALPISFVNGGVASGIIDMSQSLLGSNFMKSCSQVLLYRWILRFCDFGSLVDTGLTLGKWFPNSLILKELFPSDAATPRYQLPLYIPAATWTRFLNDSLSHIQILEGDLRFLIIWILADLEVSKFSELRLACVRQLKSVMVAHEEVLSKCKFLSCILEMLAKFLPDRKIHEEVLSIIVCLLKLADKNNLSIVEALPSLYSEILIFIKIHQTEIHHSFKVMSASICTRDIPFSKTWHYCNDIIQGNHISDNIYENDELLKVEDTNRDRVILLSLMFSHARIPEISHLNVEPSILAVENLLKFKVPDEYVSRNFSLWSAYYLDMFESAQEMSEMFEKAGLAQQNMSFRDYFVDPGSLCFLFDKFFQFYEDNLPFQSCQIQLLWESTMEFLLNKYQKNDEDPMRISELYYDKYKGRITYMDSKLFGLVNGGPKSLCSMEAFVTSHFLSSGESYSSWLQNFVGSLIAHLCLNMPDMKLFYYLSLAYHSFAESIITILFNLLMYYDPKKGIYWAGRMFSDIEKLLVVAEPAEKTFCILQIISMLRSGNRINDRHCVSAYASLPLKSVCESALKTHQVAFSYMLFEEYSMKDLGNLDTVTLGTIYESLGDVELMAGLPTSHNLVGALHSINKVEPTTWKSFLVNNADFNANYNEYLKGDQRPLLNATESQGFYGLASSLCSEMSTQYSSESYKWALQLGNWDLPLPQHIDTKYKGLYYGLRKLMHEDNEPLKCLQASLIMLAEKRSEFISQTEWVSTISNISLLQRFASSMKTVESAAATLRNLTILDEQKLEYCEFESYKSIVQAKYLLLDILSRKEENAGNHVPSEIKTVNVVQLANDVKYAIENKSPQDALRYAFTLDGLIKQINAMDPEFPLLLSLKRLSSFVSATALWECKEFKTPILILKDLLYQHKGQENENSTYQHFEYLLKVPDDYIKAMLVKWTSQSRFEAPSVIFEKYIRHFDTKIKDYDLRASMFYIMGNFLSQQVQKLQASKEIEERQHRCDRQANESHALETIHKNTSLPDNERQDAKRHYNRVKVQLENDTEILNSLKIQRVQFVSKALHYFLNTLVFTNKYDEDVLDKFCGLWFEHDRDDEINILLFKEIGSVPSWKFLPWVNQIASKLSIERTKFQKPLQLTMKRLLFKLPYDSLYSVMSILFYGKESVNLNFRVSQKVQAVEKLLKELQGFEKGTYFSKYVLPIKEFCEKSVELANTKFELKSKSSKKLHLPGLIMGEYWLNFLPSQKLPLPTVHVPIKSSNDGKLARPYITSTVETVDISSSGISLPKILTFYISDGTKRKVLIKGSNDDLRQDAIMEQVFGQVNKILQTDKQMRKLNLNISTYEVIPLGPNAGIIEFVAHSISLHQILTVLHRNDTVCFDQARRSMKAVQTKSKTERITTFKNLVEEIQPQLRNFFFDYFPEPLEWLSAKKTYTKGIAASSIVGYILGLGDRHLNNILLDYKTGKPIHIDLGVAFDQGRLLPIPELVPFRLTRDMVDGFGVTGVDGLFRKSCENTYSVLRENREKVMYVLNILKWDPLYSWVMSPVRRHRHLLEEDSQLYGSLNLEEMESGAKHKEENQESFRALKGVEEKLIGNGLSVDATVQELIQQATDVENLALIYMGWSPFY